MKISAINGLSILRPTNNTQKTSYSTPLLKADSVSFGSSAKAVKQDVNVDIDTAKFVANSLSTSTSGHRAPYMSDKFNPDIVRLITLGVADYAKQEAAKTGKRPTVLIGGDTREASRKSLPLIKDTLLKQNVDVINIDEPVPTPLLAIAARDYNADLAVLMTASHNPWADGGYNLVTKAGAIAPASVTQQVASNFVKTAEKGSYFEYPNNKSKLTEIYPYENYKDQLNSLNLIDWENIKNSGIEVFYDGLNGSGNYVMPELLKDYGIPFTQVISEGQEGPNPIEKNLGDLSAAVKSSDAKLKVGISNDGDADRFGIVDEKGNFVPANDVLLLASYHLAKNKGIEGTIIRSQATTKQLDGVAQLYGLDVKETPVGFKYIAEDIEDLRRKGKDILLAGEESGGLTVNGHIPEKDGIIALSLVMDLLATEKKPISELLEDIKGVCPQIYSTGNFNKKLNDESAKEVIMSRAQKMYDDALNGKVDFGTTHKIDVEKTKANQASMESYRKGGDGIKLFMTDGSTVLVRKSGTEPLVKCYIEAAGSTQAKADANRDVLKGVMEQVFTI